MLNRFAIFVAVFALIVVGTGAVVTSSQEIIAAGNSTSVETPALSSVHPVLGIVLCGLTVALALALWLSKRGAIRTLAMAAIVLCAADAFAAQQSSAPDRAVLHAWLAAGFFAVLSAIVLFTSEHWTREPEMVDDRGFRFLRPLGIATPPLVLIQIVLGAMYRHKLTSVFFHMGGALVVSLATLVAAMVVIQHFPEHRALKNSATALMSVVLTQVAFGVAAFTLQLLDTGNALALQLATVSHVVVGNLTLAASLIFAIEAQRSLRSGAQASRE
jgi:heme A synthase